MTKIKSVSLREINPVEKTGRQTLNERIDIECWNGCQKSGTCTFPQCKDPGNARAHLDKYVTN